MPLLGKLSIQLRDDFHALVDAQDAAVQRQVVVLGMTPLHVGVEAVIRRTALVLATQALLRGLLPLAVDLHDALGTERHVRMDTVKSLVAPKAVTLASVMFSLRASSFTCSRISSPLSIHATILSSNLLYSIVKHSLRFDFSCGIFIVVLALGFLSRRI